MTVSATIIACLLLLLLLTLAIPARGATKEKQQPRRPLPWLVNDYPHPDKESSSSLLLPYCRSRSKRFCDPDGILQTTDDLERLDEALSVVVRSQHVCPEAEKDDNEKENGVEVQFAVAFVDKMDLTPFQEKYTNGSHQHQDNIESLAAETFGQSIHNNWGVGLNRPQCGGGTGVLIFISRQDRAVYISRGGALDKVLTNDRLQHNIIEQAMKPLLRQGQFAQASIQAINEMNYYLQSGPPSFWEKHASSMMIFSFITVFASIVCWGEYKNHQDRKRYSQVTRHLNEIDQARAEALQGRFQCLSCPICLEPFQAPPSTTPPVAPPEPALPVNGRDSSEENGMNETANGTGMEISNNNNNNINTEQPKLGSDGLPITLLRCGHVFDQTCWLDWVHSGRGQIDKCPICKQHVDGGIGTRIHTDRQSQAPARHTNAERLFRRRNDAGTYHQNERNINDSTINRDQTASNPGPEDNNNNSRDDGSYFPRQDSQARQRQLIQDRILAMYMFERNFRLAQLGHYYPQFVGPEQIQQWTRSNYSGQLVRDPAFVRVDPQVRAAVEAAERARNQSNNNSRGGGGRNSSGFGGGRSGGGVGGRW